jgi:hypothetical protein
VAKEYRTTLILDESRHRKIKEYQVNHNKSMKDIVYLALDSFFMVDGEKKDRKSRKHPEIDVSDFVNAVVFELEKYLAPEMAKALLEDKCRRHGITIARLSARSLNAVLIGDICRGVSHIRNAADAKKLEKRLLELAEGGRK